MAITALLPKVELIEGRILLKKPFAEMRSSSSSDDGIEKKDDQTGADAIGQPCGEP